MSSVNVPMKNYPYTGGTPNRTSYTDENVSFPLELVWRTKIGKPGDPIVSNGKLFVSVPQDTSMGKSSVIALDMDKGEILWEVSPEDIDFIGRSLCTYNETVFFGGMINREPELFAADVSSGKILWTQKEIKGEGLLIYKDKLFVNSGFIFSIDPKSRKILWNYNPNYSASCPSVYDGCLVFGDLSAQGSGGNLFCLNADTGELIWEVDVSRVSTFWVEKADTDKLELEPGWFTSRFPVVADGKIYGSVVDCMACFDLKTGKLIWKSEGAKTPVYANGRLYSFVLGNLFCHNAESGEIIYKKEYPETASYSLSLPFLAGNSLFVGTERGLYAFNIDSGDKVWEFHSEERYAPFLSQPVFIDGRLYAGCEDGYMYCFKSKKE